MRVFTVVGPRKPSDPHYFPDIAWEYVEALVLSDAGVRAIALGECYFVAGDDDARYLHLQRNRHIFTGPVDPNFINVVVAPAGHQTGRRPRRLGEYDTGRVRWQSLAPDEIVYEPSYSFERFHTSGHRNIAITSGRHCDEEVAALSRYDAILCPLADDASQLLLRGVSARYHPSDTLKENALQLRGIVSSLDEVDVPDHLLQPLGREEGA
ncbi:MAG: hypothetical protein R3322_00260 [Kiloniellales bacterium]|nr:hypothetical protein [Kiloniellales bacterium]